MASVEFINVFFEKVARERLLGFLDISLYPVKGGGGDFRLARISLDVRHECSKRSRRYYGFKKRKERGREGRKKRGRRIEGSKNK